MNMKRKIKITIKTIGWIIKKTKERLNELKKEYEDIVYNVDKPYIHTVDVKPIDSRTIICFIESDNIDNHYYVVQDKVDNARWNKLLDLGLKYWAYCDDIFNIY